MKKTLETKISEAKNLLDVLLILKEVTMQDIHVGSLAYVTKIIQQIDEDNKYGIVECKPFPLEEGQEEYVIQAYFVSDSCNNLTSGEIIQVLFNDRNFINNLNATSPKITLDVSNHTIKFAIVVPLSGASTLTEEQKEEILNI